MKKIIILFLLFLQSEFVFANTQIEVIKVYDGDSILARIEDNIFRIRLIGIDCFEATDNTRAHLQAKKFNLSLNEVLKRGNIAGDILKKELDNKKVFFEFRGIDKYKRALGYIYADNVNINQKMLKTSYCSVY